jgi:hypothetical protein
VVVLQLLGKVTTAALLVEQITAVAVAAVKAAQADTGLLRTVWVEQVQLG